MVGEKFFQSVSSLSSSELNACLRYSLNPSFNKRLEISSTIKLFKKSKEDFILLQKNEEKLHKKIFGNQEKYDKKTLVDHFHYCLNLVENFIVYSVVQNDKDEQLKILENFYSDRGCEREAEAINLKRIKLTRSKNISINSYLSLYDLYINKFRITVKRFENETFENVKIALDNLDKFYFLAKMHWSQELDVLNLVSKCDYDKRLLKEIREIVENDTDISKKLLFKIYIETNKLYNGDFSAEKYFQFKDLILKNLDKLEAKSKKQYVTDWSNYGSYMYSREPTMEWLQENFEILKIESDNDLLIVKNKVTDAKFSQGIRIALTLKEFDWADKFINKYKDYVNNENLVLKMQAEVHYNKGDYENSLELINRIPLKTFTDNYEIKTLYSKILFDKGEYDLLENHLNTFELYLRRYKDITEDLRDRNLNFVLYLGRLHRNLNNKKKLEKLFNDVTENKLLFNRSWLLSKISLHK